MTQDYEPIELNKNTPEPEEDGAFLINTDGTLYQVVVHDSTFDLTHTWLCDGFWGKWSDISQHRKPGGHTTIQSLAAHDAQIRAEALNLSDEEQQLVTGVFDTDPYLEHLAAGNALQDYDERQAYLTQLFNSTLLGLFPMIVAHRKEQQQ